MTDWPPAVEVLNETGASRFMLTCEHASNHVPADYKALGLTGRDLETHIAWDIGAAELTRRLSAMLDAPAFLGGYSRLLIDLNRPLDASSRIVTRSDGTEIPGNRDLGPGEVGRRVERIFRPFHDRVSDHLDQRRGDNRPTQLVSIHSFTPVLGGVARPWQAGVLFGAAEALGLSIVERLNRRGLKAGANVPYSTSRDEDYTVPIHGDDRGIPAILIEIRNDLILDAAGIAEWAGILANVLSE